MKKTIKFIVAGGVAVVALAVAALAMLKADGDFLDEDFDIAD